MSGIFGCIGSGELHWIVQGKDLMMARIFGRIDRLKRMVRQVQEAPRDNAKQQDHDYR